MCVKALYTDIRTIRKKDEKETDTLLRSADAFVDAQRLSERKEYISICVVIDDNILLAFKSQIIVYP